MLSDRQLALLLVLPLIFLQFIICIYPIVYSLWLSFYDVKLMARTMRFVGLANYLKLGADPLFKHSLTISLRFVVETVALIVAISLFAALIMNERIKGKSILKVAVIMPWALSEFAVAIAARFFLDRNYGFLNALLKNLGIIKEGINFLTANYAVEWLAIFYAWNVAPIGAYFILSALQTIPEDLYKQAKIDGASALLRFRAVVFPFISYAVLITAALATILAASSIVLCFALTGGGPGFASLLATLYDFRVFFYNQDFGYGAAISWILLALVMVVVVLYFVLLTRRR